MEDNKPTTREGVIDSAAALHERLSAYLGRCEAQESFPNLAGFCRFCGFGEDGFGQLRRQFPEVCDLVMAAFEDIALNADRPVTLLTAYLKYRLWHGEQEDGGEPEVIFVEQALVDDGE